MIVLKSPEELSRMRLACQAAAEVLAEVALMVVPGRKTMELDEAAAELMRKRGGKSAFLGYRGYKGQICVSVNEEVVHGLPGERRVQYGDIVSLDIGIVLDGFVGDNATTVAVGMIDWKVQRLLEVTEQSLAAGIAAARAGNRVGDISHAVQRMVEAAEFNVVREFVGHGVGRTLHEDPQVPNFGAPGKGPKLKPGMTLAIEPMTTLGGSAVELLRDGWTVVTQDRKPSAHFEHTVAITEGEPEILTCRKMTLSVPKASS
ncbi:MAG: type I methionyl aminopeptidase [Verrucomicrobia bacterium]|nr:type I methionyl aminopeptidase [Verrucomicrobiota bacterium]